MATVEWCEWDSSACGRESRARAGAGPGASVDARERHKLAERERRKSMRELFLSLHALLPHASTVRKEQSAILDEIIKYIPLAAARLKSLQSRKEAPPPSLPQQRLIRGQEAGRGGCAAPAVQLSDRSSESSGSGDCDIRMSPEPSASVAIRVRGDRVNVSLTDTRGNSQAVLLSAVLDELEAHHLDLVRSTHCRDGSKLLHHSESKICDGLEGSPALLKERLQDLACKLHNLRKSSNLKRTYDQIST